MRYPLVELLVGLLFLALALGEGLVGGRNLPVPPDAPRFFSLKPLQYWSVYGYHSILLVTLFTVALIRFDGERVPRQVFLPALLVGLAASPVFVWLHPVHVCYVVAAPDWFVGVSRCRCGVCWPVWCMGSVSGRRPCRSAGCRTWETTRVVGDALVRCVSGMASRRGVGAGGGGRHIGGCDGYPVRPVAGRTGPWCGYLTLAGLLYIIKWGHLVERFPSLGPHSNIGVLCVLALAACGVSLVTGAWMRSQHPGEHMSLADREMP